MTFRFIDQHRDQWPVRLLGDALDVSPAGYYAWRERPAESFFASLKKELVHGADFATRAEARAATVEYIEVFYNTRRRHSSLGYVSPAEYGQTA